MNYEVSTTIWVPVVMIDATDRLTPVTGITSGLNLRYGMQDGGTTWSTIAIGASTWKEKGFGMYSMRIEAGLNATKGILCYSVTDTGSENVLPFYGDVQIVAHDPEDDIDTIKSNVSTIITNLAAVAADATIVRKIETNNWKIENNQMIFYDDDGITALYTFNLLDSSSNPTMEEPFERQQV